MIPVTTAVEDADGGACSTSGATISAPGNHTTSRNRHVGRLVRVERAVDAHGPAASAVVPIQLDGG